MKVSVDLLAYNHEKFIAKALDSILMQQVDFDYEIVIGEDCSTDKTRDIVINYHQKHPDKIRLLLHKQNLGSINNDIEVLKTCQSEYIAYLEGDDYWTSPHKLQKQVEYLDKHPDCSACFHPVTIFCESGSFEPYISPYYSYRRVLSLEDLLESTTITTCSLMLRKSALDESFIDVYSKSVIGDWELFLFLAQRGSIGYVDETMAAYRKHSGGIYTGASSFKKLKDRIEMFKNLDAYFNFKYSKTYNELISRCNHALAIEYVYSNNLSDARRHFLKSVFECPFNKRKSRKDVIKTFIRLYAPPLFKLWGLKLIQDPRLL